MQSSQVRIVIADDHTLFRQGLKQLLELEKDFTVVAEVGSGEEAFQSTRTLMPDVVVLDVSMPGGGMEACARIKQSFPNIGVVILTMHEDQEYLMRALKAGANSYLVKDVDSSNFAEAIRAARDGRPYLHPKLAGLALMEVARGGDSRNRGGSDAGLTEREIEVLRLVGQGASNRDIAQALFISEKTAKNHLTHIFEKLGVSDRTQAALYAVRSGLVKLEKTRS
ncbi:MAG TPA: response regulator transcription factor [Symbiobacteriaceae bacterium]